MTKATVATLKSFIRRNRNNLYVSVRSNFDSSVDCVTQRGGKFTPAQETDMSEKHTLGILGIWLVGQSRDYVQPYQKDGFTGLEVSNCCDNWIVAIAA